NGSNGADDRAALQKEVGALQQELTRISETTKFGATSLLDGTFGTKQFQVGSNANETINVSLGNMAADAIGAYDVEGAGSVFGDVAAAGNLAANETITADPNLNINGTGVPILATDGADGVADKINAAATGVTATAKLEVTLSGITSADNATINIGEDSYDLAAYGGDMERLTEDLVADGYDAVYDSAAGGSIALKAEGVGGIEAIAETSGTPAGTLKFDAVTVATADSSKTSELHLTSPDKIGISGTTVDEILGGSITGTGGEGELTTVEDIDISGTTSVGAQSAIQTIDAALAQIDSQRADLGAVQNRFSHTISNLSNVAENVSASRSRIEDTDFASETATMTKNQILQQAGTTILAQSNQLPQAALSLLG
ncbi:flagellin, partial [Colwellia sp. 2_MG-2023]|uniref:flagellin n=2 Tax=Colwellia TaxID=28228 RepID=UPI0026E2D6B5